MDVSTLDTASAKLILELELQDVDALHAGLGAGPQMTALRQRREELREQLEQVTWVAEVEANIQRDRQSILKDGAEAGLTEEETEAAYDREFFARVSEPYLERCNDRRQSGRGHNKKRSDRYSSPSEEDVFWDAESIASLQRDDSDREYSTPLEGIIRGEHLASEVGSLSLDDNENCKRTLDTPQPQSLVDIPHARCDVCWSHVPIENTHTLDCEPDPHVYCYVCLLHLVDAIDSDVSLFPPRCCKKPIPLELCRAVLPKEKIKEFDLKVEELATPNPTYCWSCAKFIRINEIKGDVATCVFCEEKTCATCKAEEHDGLCLEDPHVRLLKDLAQRARWQQCSECHNYVELSAGCFHVTCLCKHEFCYLCGVKWKQCRCPQFGEEFLLRLEPEALPDPPRADPPEVQLAWDPAHVDHRWAREYGADCQDCGATYLPWVLRCSTAGCGLALCWRCIDNRD